MEWFFWILMALAAYSYAGYPLLLLLLPRRAHASTDSGAVTAVSVIIAARNEAGRIADKIANTLALSHPGVRLEVIVASDASDDSTDEIVGRFADKGVILARSPERRGKEHAQRVAITASSGEVLIFTDAGTTIPQESLSAILASFRDPEVGALSSVDRIIADDGVEQGEGLYVRYEMWLRDLEASFNTLVGLSGSFFAARRVVCQDWDTRIPSDFGTALNCARLGYRAVSSRDVIGLYRNISDPSKEYGRKLRTVLRGMVGLQHRVEVLNPSRFGAFAFQVFSHKLMRWAVPWFLLLGFVVNLFLLSGSPLYRLTAAGLLLLFTSPLLTRFLPFIAEISVVRFASFFVEANLAILQASLRVMRGHTMTTWEPSKR